jgi:small conductance mechanosensitive channel
MTASERLANAWMTAWAALSGLSLSEVALNIGLTAAILGAAWVVARLAGRFFRGLSHHVPGAPTADKMVRTSRLGRLLLLVVRAGLVVVALALVASVWGLDVPAWAATDPGRRYAGAVLRLVLVLTGAAVAVEAAGFVIGRAMERMASGSPDMRRQAQLRTLNPLLKGAAQSGIVVVAALTALGEIGVEVGPLLAGAGVVGIALGFGAQTLVKDLLTGVFLIIEDIVSVGDIVKITDSAGVVEAMTLRTIRLRDLDGTLHVFPYGEAQVVHNMTKTFSFYVFNLRVSYASDIERAFRIMREVGQNLQRDRDFADKILEPLEILGVDSLGENGVVLKARFKTLPAHQWAIGREYNRRIKQAFDRAGVEIPLPHMKVVLPEGQLSELAAP